MLILVGTMPIAYALNRTLPPEQAPRVAALAEVTENRLLKQFPGNLPTDPREVLTQYVRDSQLTPDVLPALARLSGIIGDQIRQYGSVDKIPAQAVSNTRNDMYLASETIKHLKNNPDLQLPLETSQNLDALKKSSITPRVSFRSGSKWPLLWRSDWAPWSAGGVLSSPLARRSAKRT